MEWDHNLRIYSINIIRWMTVSFQLPWWMLEYTFSIIFRKIQQFLHHVIIPFNSSRFLFFFYFPRFSLWHFHLIYMYICTRTENSSAFSIYISKKEMQSLAVEVDYVRGCGRFIWIHVNENGGKLYKNKIINFLI